MKKYLSLILILLIVVLSSSTFIACNNKKEYSVSISDNDIALLTLHCFDGHNESKLGLFNLGHTFISINNISEQDIYINNHIIKSQDTITLSTWFIFDHAGIWYNIESNYIKLYDKYNGRVSVTIGITAEDIILINDYINSHNNWSLFNNCSNFSLNLWNTVSSESEYISVPLICTPNYVAGQICKFKSYDTNQEIKTSEYIGYYHNNKFKSFKLEG